MERKQTGRPRGRPKSLFKEPQSDTVKALDRGIGLLKVLSGDGSQSLSDLAQRVNIPSSTTHRLVATLQKHGLVEFDEGFQTWSIGIEAFRIGSSYLANTNLVDAARTILRSLMEQSGET
jgi:IclR family acetate operon transcriptional repressor